MNKFSKSSLDNLNTCDQALRSIFVRVLRLHDCTIMEGARGEQRQNDLFDQGLTKVRWPDSAHNAPSGQSQAVDAAPYLAGRGIPWPVVGSPTYVKDMQQWAYFAGLVIATGREMGYTVRWGGDWDRDHNLSDQTFNDLPHYELV